MRLRKKGDYESMIMLYAVQEEASRLDGVAL
jgi:hypothetical protein